MEKRNYVTSGRTVETGKSVDSMIEDAAVLFGTEKKAENSFEKKASAEDEKSDSSN